jgi:DNA replication ATP-dependent helicase Dna2
MLVRDVLGAYREHGLSFSSVGVIAPFRAQVATIRRVLQERFPESEREIRGAVDTVDRFQGQEKELVIVSLSTYGEFVHELLQDERRLNVALTRAKHKLIILGDATVLRAEPAYYSLIRHCTVLGSNRYSREER